MFSTDPLHRSECGYAIEIEYVLYRMCSLQTLYTAVSVDTPAEAAWFLYLSLYLRAKEGGPFFNKKIANSPMMRGKKNSKLTKGDESSKQTGPKKKNSPRAQEFEVRGVNSAKKSA